MFGVTNRTVAGAPGGIGGSAGDEWSEGHHPPNHTPTPWTTPTGKNIAEAISSGRHPLDAQNTIDVSQAE